MAAFPLLSNTASLRLSPGRQSLRATLAGGACEIGGMAVLLFPLTLSRRSRRQGLHALRAFAVGRLTPPDCCAAPCWTGSGQFRPSNWSMIMSQLSLVFDASLMIRDEQGRYLPATAEQILDAARKVIDQKVQRGAAFTSSELVKDYLIAKLGGFEHEVFSVLFLDAKHRLIQYAEMFRGTIDSASVYPREVVKEALHLNAAAAIFAHNHPSGNPEPSQADKVLTQRLKESLALVDVRSLDHVIVAGQRTVSFAELGLL